MNKNALLITHYFNLMTSENTNLNKYSTPLIKRQSKVEPHAHKSSSSKMNKCQAFFALCKCYCAINVLLTPKAFKNGGYLLSPIALMLACSLQTLCAIKLSQCGMKLKKCSYPDIVGKALGKRFRKLLEIMLAIV